ncbi:MAG: class I SAM-dependent methyltransferase [Anaerolineales bacterium]
MGMNGRAEKDFLWLHLRELPYFRALVRAVEASYYQDFTLPSPCLDIGCGDGHFTSLVFDAPVDVGIDPGNAPLREAAHRLSYLSLVQGDAGLLPFPNNYFGSAFSNSVLEHIPHVQEVLSEAARVLKPGAPFLFCVPNPRYLSELSVPAWLSRVRLNRLAYAYTDWFRRMSRVHHAQPPEIWTGWLKEAGFRLEKWWHYFSPQAMHALEWGHYLGAPTLLPRLTTGRWLFVPRRWNLALTERLIRRYAQTDPHPQGTFTFFVAVKPDS